MSRKVFISFLGITNYDPIIYLPSGGNLMDYQPIRFVQEATIQTYCKDFRASDKILIFTTQSALKNWHDGEHYSNKSKKNEWHEGLKTRLEKLNLSVPCIHVDILEGKEAKDIWKNFETIFQQLESRDELIFDITHSFRSIPMLNMVLMNYAKLLKEVSVSGIYYGAFEAKTMIEEKEVAPIWDVSAFSKIQDWTNNANIFLKTGNAKSLVAQIATEPYHQLKNYLLNFSQYNLVNRGMDIYRGTDMTELSQRLGSPIEDSDPAMSALKPILEKIKTEFDNYQNNSVYNGFVSVKWCIQNGLFQQAATLLEEFITTFMMLEVGESVEDIQNKDKRSTVSAALTLTNDAKFEYVRVPERYEIDGKRITNQSVEDKTKFRMWQQAILPAIRAYRYKKELGNLAASIKQSIRNDMAHAGFNKDARSYAALEESLKKRYNETKKLIFKIKAIRLPELLP
jgi:CRISPR-associated Csx2 family protein